MKIILSELQHGYPWIVSTNQKTYTKGYIVDPMDHQRYLSGWELNLLFQQYKDERQVVQQLSSLNGNFSAILCWDEKSTTAIVDRQRTFPLFYCEQDGDVIITDRVDCGELKRAIDCERFHQFSRTICSYRDTTLYKGIFQIMPAHYLSVGQGVFFQRQYYSYRYNINRELSTNEKLKKMTENYDAIFSRVVHYLDGRQVVLPLSGGRDSRLILYYLLKYKYTNILTFSYGYEGTDDQRLSKTVADYFCVPYHYVHCNRLKMRKMSAKHFEPYLRFAGNGCSLPCVQELYAIYELMQKGLLEKDCVFMPGHGGDFYAGARAVDIGGSNSKEWRQGIFEHLFFKEYKYTNTHRSEQERICEAERLLDENAILPSVVKSREDASEWVERYYFNERESKYIQNCVRYYDYWNYEWLAPLEDICLSELWLTFSLDDRIDRRLLDEWMKRNFPPTLYSIGFAGKPKTVLKLKWSYGYIPAVDYFKYRFCGKYVSMNQFVWEKYSCVLKKEKNEQQ